MKNIELGELKVVFVFVLLDSENPLTTTCSLSHTALSATNVIH